MKRILASIAILLGMVAPSWAQYPGPQGPMMFSATCIGTLNYGKAALCYDTTLHTFNYWNGTTFTVVPGNQAIGGTGTSLATSATTEYFIPGTTSAATATEGNAEIPWPYAETVTKISCSFTAAQGAAKSDAITFTDTTNACATPITCTATNAQTCTATAGKCVIALNDIVTYADVTTGSGIAARAGSCVVSP